MALSRGVRQGRLAQLRFAGQAMCQESLFDLLERGLGDRMAGIAGKFRPEGAGKGPAGPGPPSALLPARWPDPVGQVLEVDAWIAQERAWRGLPQDPSHGGIGEGPSVQHWIARLQLRPERPVEA